MNKIKFGFGQIANATPDFAKWLFRIVLYAVAIANLICTVVEEIPAPVKLVIYHYSAMLVALVHGLSRMFGIEVDEPKYGNFKMDENSSQ